MPGSRRNRRSRSRKSPSQRTMAINPPTRVQNGADKTRDSCLSSPDWRPRIRTNLPCVDGSPEYVEMVARPDSPAAAVAAQQPYKIGMGAALNVARYLSGAGASGYLRAGGDDHQGQCGRSRGGLPAKVAGPFTRREDRPSSGSGQGQVRQEAGLSCWGSIGVVVVGFVAGRSAAISPSRQEGRQPRCTGCHRSFRHLSVTASQSLIIRNPIEDFQGKLSKKPRRPPQMRLFPGRAHGTAPGFPEALV